jgi:hypothetical protein
MLWNYLRNKVRQAVLAGIGDALAEVEDSDVATHAEVAALLCQRLHPALPAPSAAPPRDAKGEGKTARRRQPA